MKRIFLTLGLAVAASCAFAQGPSSEIQILRQRGQTGRFEPNFIRRLKLPVQRAGPRPSKPLSPLPMQPIRGSGGSDSSSDLCSRWHNYFSISCKCIDRFWRVPRDGFPT